MVGLFSRIWWISPPGHPVWNCHNGGHRLEVTTAMGGKGFSGGVGPPWRKGGWDCGSFLWDESRTCWMTLRVCSIAIAMRGETREKAEPVDDTRDFDHRFAGNSCITLEATQPREMVVLVPSGTVGVPPCRAHHLGKV